jgi:hypothetical protein
LISNPGWMFRRKQKTHVVDYYYIMKESIKKALLFPSGYTMM